MKARELREQTAPMLSEKLIELMREHFNLRMQHGSDQLTQTHKLRLIRKNIARIKTVLAAKKGDKQ